MSSQSGNGGSASGNVSGGVGSNANSQSLSASNSSKLNAKMSTDHQATLDKGLKMKIKRTKPGSKSSEVKHEIVKATEQHQNGLLGGPAGGSSNQDETSTASSNLISSQNSGNTSINSNTLSNNSAGTKKVVTTNTSQISSNLAPSASGNNPMSTSNNTSQLNSMATKRGSSGHRREKTKEKSTHSSRASIENKVAICNDKDIQDKSICQCSVGECVSSPCTSSSCIRKNEISITQRLCNSSSNIKNSKIPPGIFLPSADTHKNTVSAASASDASSTTEGSSAITSSLSSSSAANAPGPPKRDASNGANVKISAHIAAQLAAAATNVPTLPSAETKSLSAHVLQTSVQTPSGIISATVHHTIPVPTSTVKTNVSYSSGSSTNLSGSINTISNSFADESSKSPPPKRAKHNESKVVTNTKLNKKDTMDICVGTSVGTLTEPDCLGPCEPGTSVTLEGIVWHETEGGVLVVNVTWRGKTYVGTLLDCTRHDWAPPRFCDSPTDEIDSRTPKGRGKRGRAVITPDLSNFTETRSSIYFSHSNVHSKLRNGAPKGGRNPRGSNTSTSEKTTSSSSISSGNGGSTPSTSPTAFLPPRQEKRKSKDETPSVAENDNTMVVDIANASVAPISSVSTDVTQQPQNLINPVTGLNVQITSKKCMTASPCPISPILLECPEQDCCKKYKHANGLRYHQSHAHGSTSFFDEDAIADTEEQSLTPVPSPVSTVADVGYNKKSVVTSKSVFNVAEGGGTATNESDGKDAPLTLEESVDNLEARRDIKYLESGSEQPSAQTANMSEHCSPTPTSGNQPTLDKSIDSVNKNIQVLSLPKEQTEVMDHGSSGTTGLLRFDEKTVKTENIGVFGDDVENITEAVTEQTLGKEFLPLSNTKDSYRLTSQRSDVAKNQETKVDSFTSKNDNSGLKIQNEENRNVLNTTVASPSQAANKIKKIRKSPPPDVNVEGFGTCTLPRDGVQSPAYSDISDDSTSVSEQQLQDKQQIKGSEIIKKSSDLVRTHGSGCSTSGQNTISSPLSGYGVYQFYQQNQFMVQSSGEQQQPSSTLNINQTENPASGTVQKMPVAADYNKKEPTLDLLTKSTNLNSNQLSQERSNESLSNTFPNQDTNGLSNLTSQGPVVSNPPVSSKSVSHLYAFNYMSPNYGFNVDQNYLSVQVDDDKTKRQSAILSPKDNQDQQIFKEERTKEERSPCENVQFLHQQTTPNKIIKPEPISKVENMKMDINTNSSGQASHISLHPKDLQGLGVYPNMYQRHPIGISPQQLTREEELRRYYILSDQQRRQNNVAYNTNMINTHNQAASVQPGIQQVREDSQELSTPGQAQSHQQIKIKTNPTVLGNGGKQTVIAKVSPKQKQEEEMKPIKQEGQKPTMETQGPPPPPTSQYFLHPSYIASTPFGFDPNHPMYRNVLMPASSPFNTGPYHLPMPRFHSPEDLSRNPATKALDALHHAASQYYTTHKIHELSERALKSPNNSNSNASTPNTIKGGVLSPTVVSNSHTVLNSNQIGHHSNINQPPISTQSLPSQTLPSPNKQEHLSQKTQGNNSSVQGPHHNETQKTQTSNNSTAIANSGDINAGITGGNGNGSSTTDSRSPPPQRHVHTHHHTHVGLGYPMYPAPYGAAVLASQQAAAVAVINPFSPGPTK